MLLLISYTPVLHNKDKNFIAPNLYISTDILSSPAEQWGALGGNQIAQHLGVRCRTQIPTHTPGVQVCNYLCFQREVLFLGSVLLFGAYALLLLVARIFTYLASLVLCKSGISRPARRTQSN